MSGGPNGVGVLKFTNYVVGPYASIILRNMREKVDEKKYLKHGRNSGQCF